MNQPNPYATEPPLIEQQLACRKKISLCTSCHHHHPNAHAFSHICHFRPMTQPNPLKRQIFDPFPTQPNPTQPAGQPNPRTTLMCVHIDAFDMWALRKILRIPYIRHVSNSEVRNCRPHMVTDRRLRFFGHIALSSPTQDHHQAVSAAIRKPPPDWRRPVGRPRHTWLRAVESNLRPLNIDLSSAWRKTANWDAWRSVVDTATLKTSLPRKKKKKT